MSRRDWVRYASLAFLAFAAIAAAVWWLLSEYQQYQAEHRKEVATYYPESAYTQSYDPCSGSGTLVDQINCFLREVKTQRGDKRAEYDLEAQQDMATWALGMFVISILGLLVTGTGVGLIWRTLIHTRTAAEAAVAMVDEARNTTRAAEASVEVQRNIGEAQIRAYVSVVSATVEIDEKLFYPVIRFQLRNSGNSSARQIIVGFRGSYVTGNTLRSQDDFAPKGRSSYAFGTDIASNETREITTRLSNFPFSERETSALLDGNLSFEAIVRFSFIDVFGKEIVETQDWIALVLHPGRQMPFGRVAFTRLRLMAEANAHGALKSPE